MFLRVPTPCECNISGPGSTGPSRLIYYRPFRDIFDAGVGKIKAVLLHEYIAWWSVDLFITSAGNRRCRDTNMRALIETWISKTGFFWCTMSTIYASLENAKSGKYFNKNKKCFYLEFYYQVYYRTRARQEKFHGAGQIETRPFRFQSWRWTGSLVWGQPEL